MNPREPIDVNQYGEAPMGEFELFLQKWIFRIRRSNGDETGRRTLCESLYWVSVELDK